jgi:hypothetical protein
MTGTNRTTIEATDVDEAALKWARAQPDYGWHPHGPILYAYVDIRDETGQWWLACVNPTGHRPEPY